MRNQTFSSYLLDQWLETLAAVEEETAAAVDDDEEETAAVGEEACLASVCLPHLLLHPR